MVWTFTHPIHHVARGVIYQLFMPFVIHEEKSGTNSHRLIPLGIRWLFHYTRAFAKKKKKKGEDSARLRAEDSPRGSLSREINRGTFRHI